VQLDLDGKVAIVTGGSEGIGFATAGRLADEGAAVVVCGRRADQLETARAALAGRGKVEAAVLDVADHAAYAKFIAETAAKHGRLDIIVNNAAYSAFGAIEETSDDQWDAVYRTNVGAVRIATKAALPIMRKQKAGVIINISSVTGGRASRGTSAYGSSKAAIKQFTDIAAVEAGPDNVRCITVQVGSVRTAGTDKYREDFPDQYNRAVDAIPLKRWAEPDEIGAVVAFLASNRASFITGANIAVDGGLDSAMAF
jgi:meso-butanediol dehydrogenase/(S,S)-butanediol dehydrogenase/diacetyl reductase